jgi:hypothetical protein
MKQDFQGFLTCSARVHFGDIAGDQACMAKFGYDPATYTIQQATELARAQMADHVQHPGFGVSDAIFLVIALSLAWGIGVAIVNAIRTKGRSLIGLIGSDDDDAIGSSWARTGGKTHWSTREHIDGGFHRGG